jgi:DNA-binding MltR family transcriptional regulator
MDAYENAINDLLQGTKPVDGAKPTIKTIGESDSDSWKMIALACQLTNEYMEGTEGDKVSGVVLVWAARLDNALERLLRREFVERSKATEDELNFLLKKQPLPPLGSAQIRARVARALGLISKETFNSLSIVFTLRNGHAHGDPHPVLTCDDVRPIFCSFPRETKSEIESLVASRDQSTQPLFMFMVAMFLLLSGLIVAERNISRNTRGHQKQSRCRSKTLIRGHQSKDCPKPP